jgi:outer membrane biogenesis lipoprotein LolB
MARQIPIALLASAMLLLAACGPNQYGPPVEGKPRTWGQQHYLDNQAYQKLNTDRIN